MTRVTSAGRHDTRPVCSGSRELSIPGASPGMRGPFRQGHRPAALPGGGRMSGAWTRRCVQSKVASRSRRGDGLSKTCSAPRGRSIRFGGEVSASVVSGRTRGVRRPFATPPIVFIHLPSDRRGPGARRPGRGRFESPPLVSPARLPTARHRFEEPEVVEILAGGQTHYFNYSFMG